MTGHPYTAEDDALIIRLYQRMTLQDIAARLGRPANTVTSHYHVLVRRGLIDHSKRFARRTWTADEDDYLRESWGAISDQAVAAHLHRSIVACAIRAKRHLGQARKDNIYTARMVGRIFGVDSKLVVRWIEEGWLEGRRSPVPVGRNRMWNVSDLGLERFIRRFPWRYDRTRIEPKTHWRNLADEVWARDPWLTTVEAAQRVNADPNTIVRHCARGWLRAEKTWEAGKHGGWRIPASALAGFRFRHVSKPNWRRYRPTAEPDWFVLERVDGGWRISRVAA